MVARHGGSMRTCDGASRGFRSRRDAARRHPRLSRVTRRSIARRARHARHACRHAGRAGRAALGRPKATTGATPLAARRRSRLVPGMAPPFSRSWTRGHASRRVSTSRFRRRFERQRRRFCPLSRQRVRSRAGTVHPRQSIVTARSILHAALFQDRVRPTSRTASSARWPRSSPCCRDRIG